MKKYVIPFFAKHQMYFYALIILIFLFAVAKAPYWFTRDSTNEIFFDSNTGVIGDTIGGITAPFLSAFGSILLFITIWVQIETNKKQNDRAMFEQQFQSFLHDIDSLKLDILNFPNTEYDNVKGAIALLSLSSKFYDNVDNAELNDEFDLMEFSLLTFILLTITDLITNISSSHILNEQKIILLKKIERLYSGYLLGHVSAIANRLKKHRSPNENAQIFHSAYKMTSEAISTVQELIRIS